MKVVINKHAYIEWNDNDLASIEAAEKRKALFENKGYTLIDSKTNIITGKNSLTYNTK